MFPEVAKAYASSFDVQRGKVKGSGDEYNTAVEAENAKRGAAAAAARQSDLSDPSKYQKVKKADGGFDFYDPSGKQVDIATLAQRTGTDPGYWVKDSQNPIDLQYLNDSAHLQKFMDAVVSRDTETIKGYKDADPMLNRYADDKDGIHKLIEDFNKSYQRYYTPNWGASVPQSPYFAYPQSGPPGGGNTTGYTGGGGGGLTTR